jgi:hypothetical protein
VQIQQLELENFRGHTHLRLEAAPITVLMGRNNVGKSAVIQALTLLSRAARFTPLTFPDTGFNSFASVSRHGSSDGVRIATTMVPSPTDNAAVQEVRYDLCLGAPDPKSGSATILSESLCVAGEELFRRTAGEYDGNLASLLAAADLVNVLERGSVWAALSRLRNGPIAYNEDSLKVAHHLLRRCGHYRLIPYRVCQPGSPLDEMDDGREPQPPFIEPTGRKTVDLLIWMSRYEPDRLSAVVDALGKAIDGLAALTFRASAENAEELELVAVFQDDRQEVPASQLSDGTRNLLGLLAILNSPNFFPLACFEEPEIGLTAQATEVFVEEMWRSLKDTRRKQQILISTHSPFLLESLDRHMSHAGGQSLQHSALVLSRDRDSGVTSAESARGHIDRAPFLGERVRQMDAVDWADLLRSL